MEAYVHMKSKWTKHIVEELMFHLDILFHEGKYPVSEMSYTLLSYWPKWSHRLLQTSYTVAKDICCSPQPESSALLLKIALTYAIEHEEIEVILN